MSVLIISAKQLTKISRQPVGQIIQTKLKELLLSSFTISNFSYCPFIWVYCSKKSTKKINAVHEKSLRIIPNDYESTCSLLLEEARKEIFQQLWKNSLMIEVYECLNPHPPDITNDISKFSKTSLSSRQKSHCGVEEDGRIGLSS